jgi:hypothetical protein
LDIKHYGRAQIADIQNQGRAIDMNKIDKVREKPGSASPENK